MARRMRSFRLLALLTFASIGGAAWYANAAGDAKDNVNQRSAELVTTDTLGGAARYLTYVSTDKPIYRGGETVFVRGVVLHHETRKPLPNDIVYSAVIEVTGPKGDIVASGTSTSTDSVHGFSWLVPNDQAGGEYTLKVTYPSYGLAPAERKFDIRAYRPPRLKSQIKFLRDGFGPGDDVVATLHTERAEGGIPAGANVTISARIDGEECFRGPASVDAKGDCVAKFQLPSEIVRGEGTLAMIIEDGGIVETASKSIPILLQTVDLTMYPEGGQLVGGLKNRVYLQAFTPTGKPADLAGIIVDESDKEVAVFRSEHEGRGRFTFTPKAGSKYALKITEPAGIKTRFDLPEVMRRGAVISSKHDVVAAGKSIKLRIGLQGIDGAFVSLCKREQEIARAAIDGSRQGKLRTFVFDSPGDVDGVLIATVWSKDHKPLAERLIFVEPRRSVQVTLMADETKYVPGGRAAIKVETRDADGQPTSAVVGVNVTDDSVLEMIDRRDQSPRLPVMVLLEGEVKDLADAHVYLDPENAKAEVAVDLLLGTQGWRRFAHVKENVAKFIVEHGDQARRMLAQQLAVDNSHRGWRSEELKRVNGKMEIFEEEFLREAPVDAFGLDEIKNLPRRAAPIKNPAPADDAGVELAKAEPEQPSASQAREPVSEPQQELAQAIKEAEAGANEARLFADMEDLEVVSISDDFQAIRIYAHDLQSNREPNQRTDFTETLFWHAGVKTNENGQATIEFALNDSVTSFRVFADAFDSDDALGTKSLQIDSVEPLYLEPKYPLEVTSGDIIRMPVGIVNSTGANLASQFELTATGMERIGSGKVRFDLFADTRIRQIVNLRVGDQFGVNPITAGVKAGPYSDQVTRNITVKPFGFPIEVGYGGLLFPDGSAHHEIVIPKNIVAGSMSAKIVVHPTPLASLTQALERLIREPSGCFEQTSSTVYPLIMAQQYFMSHEGVDPTLIDRSIGILDRGYDRLIGFECDGGGFEWFGQDPGHDALTAYGLMEFTDMAEVRYVDPEMLGRTKKWFLAQRDGKGGFKRNTHTLHTWLPDPEISNSYNTWAALSAGVDADLSSEIEYAGRVAETTENTYVTALGANVMLLGGQFDAANHLLEMLASRQAEDGAVAGATKSVVGSGGDALAIETTALAVMAWLTNPSYTANVEKSIQYLAESCQGGRYGSTQSTVLALKAIVEYDKSRAKPTASGSLQLLVDDQPFGDPVAFSEETQGAIELPDPSSSLTSGEHTITVAMSDGSQMPHSVALNYHTVTPATSKECQLRLETQISDPTTSEGDITEMQVVLVNRSDEKVPSPLAIIGVPGGMEPRHDQLKELVKEGRIAAYEVLGREIVLYWRVLDADERVELPISLIAAIPGEYTAPASRAYLYYTDEHKHWTSGVKVDIAAKATAAR